MKLLLIFLIFLTGCFAPRREWEFVGKVKKEFVETHEGKMVEVYKINP